jgi:hypothetical protein
MLGRVMASFRFLVTASLVVGALIAGAASTIVGLRAIIASGSLMGSGGNYSGGPVAGSEDPNPRRTYRWGATMASDSVRARPLMVPRSPDFARPDATGERLMLINQPQQRVHRAGDRHFDTMSLRGAEDRAGDRVVFEPLAPLHVLKC